MGAAAPPTPATLEVRTVDARGSVLLPAEFAGATVTVERVSDTEVRIRKAGEVAGDESPVTDDRLLPLSDRDRDLVLDMMDNPPEPSPAFLAAAERYRKRYG